MPRLWVLITLCILVLFSHNVIAETSASNIPWQEYSATVFDQAKKTNHIILLYGKSSECHWCQQMDATTWQTPDVIQEIAKDYIPVRFEVDANTDLVLRYKISSLPAIILLDGDKHVLKQFAGYFPPDFILKYLKETAGGSTSVTPAAVPSASTDPFEQIKANQIKIYHDNLLPTWKTADFSVEEFPLTLAAEGSPVASIWVKNALHQQMNLFDPVWNGFYAGVDAGKINYTKKAWMQAQALKLYTQAYAVFQDPNDLVTAKKIINYVDNFLTSADGAFYTEQSAYSTSDVENSRYYLLDDQNRRKLGLPSINTTIIARDNGMMITGLADYYMESGETSALIKAMKAAQWLNANLSSQDGGFHHDKTDSAMYLADQVAIGSALISLFQATTDHEYLKQAIATAQYINKNFTNSAEGFVTSNQSTVVDPIENAKLTQFASLLFNYTGDNTYKQMQQKAFHYLQKSDVIAITPAPITLMSEYDVRVNPNHIVIVGAKSDPVAKKLYAVGMLLAPLYTRIDWWDRSEGPLLNSDVNYPVMSQAAAYVCRGFQCSFPIFSAKELLALLYKQDQVVNAPLNQTKSVKVQKSVDNSSAFEKLLNGRNWALIIISFIGFGLLLSFTPCVLPLVPIMASIIVGQTIGVKKEKTFLLCLTYVLSMSVTYAILGLLAGIFGVYLQIYMESQGVIILFGLLFLTLSLSMLGAFELQLPNFIQNKITEKSAMQEGGTYVGVMGMGVLGTLIISPCVTAPLAGILSFIMKTSNYTLGAVSLFCLSFGMGLPLLIISYFSKNILPRASQWNDQIKVFFGLILMGVAIWVISRIIPILWTQALISVFLILTSVYMGLMQHKTKTMLSKFWKTLTLICFLYAVGLFYSVIFMEGEGLQMLDFTSPEMVASTNSSDFKNINNTNELKQALQEAQNNHLPIVLDFSAKWCASCKRLEREVLDEASVKDILHKFMLLRVDLTNVKSDNMELAHQFNVVAPPVVVFFDSYGQLSPERVTGEVDVSHFKQNLQQVLH